MAIHGVLCGVLFLTHTGVLAREILRYAETQHSRNEAGVPGNNVTGGWSWVDEAGERHDIWYVADTRGFRAFGDGIPASSQSPLVIGTPVVVGLKGLKGRREPVALGTPALPPPAISRGTSAQPPSVLPVASPLRQPQDFGRPEQESVVAVVHASGMREGRPALKSKAEVMTEAAHGDQVEASVFIATSVFPNPGGAEATAAPPADVQTFDVAPLPVGDSVQLSKVANSPPTDADSFNSPSKAKPSSASENVLVNRGLGKIATATADESSVATEGPSHMENLDTSFLMSAILGPVSGTDFVIIDKLRVPNAPKPRVGSQQLVPQPVPLKGQPPPVIMGLHTSGRPPQSHRLSQNTRPLQPLGIHLLNLVPFKGNSKSIDSNGPVPKPMRVVGAPNLENFYRPATLALTTPSPFRLPRPIRDYDYQYYDYQYYDYAEGEGEDTGGGPSKSTRSSKSTRDSSDESSAEPDFPDSEEKDD